MMTTFGGRSAASSSPGTRAASRNRAGVLIGSPIGRRAMVRARPGWFMRNPARRLLDRRTGARYLRECPQIQEPVAMSFLCRKPFALGTAVLALAGVAGGAPARPPDADWKAGVA